MQKNHFYDETKYQTFTIILSNWHFYNQGCVCMCIFMYEQSNFPMFHLCRQLYPQDLVDQFLMTYQKIWSGCGKHSGKYKITRFSCSSVKNITLCLLCFACRRCLMPHGFIQDLNLLTSLLCGTVFRMQSPQELLQALQDRGQAFG